MFAIGQSAELFSLRDYAACSDFVEEKAGVTDANALRTRGATRVPSSSIARIILAWGKSATLI